MGNPAHGENILAHLHSEALKQRITTIEQFDVIDSTSTYLSQQSPTPLHHIRVAQAREQTQGRGRRQRSWQSQKDHGLLTSIGITLAKDNPCKPLLSLMVATRIIHALEKLGCPTPMKIKWPNDLYINMQKFGGILIESEPCPVGDYYIIGIGINLLPQPMIKSSNMSEFWPNMPSVDVILAALITAIDVFTTPDQALKDFHLAWPKLDLTRQHSILVTEKDCFWPDTSLGINQDGLLMTRRGHLLSPHLHSICLINQKPSEEMFDI